MKKQTNRFRNRNLGKIATVTAIAAISFAGATEAAIVHSGVINQTLSSSNSGVNPSTTFDVDIDGDATPEFEFDMFYDGKITKQAILRVATKNTGKVDDNASNTVTKVSLNQSIGAAGTYSTLTLGQIWNPGLWGDAETAYMGGSFQLNGNTHYAWVQITMNKNSSPSSVTINDWAYETIADTAILAGQTVYDSDGVDDVIESAVPDADGSGTGDGNNDGTADSSQSHVSSLKTHDTNNYITVDNTDDKNLTAVSASAAPADLPAGVTFPYDMVGFTVNGVANGATVTMDIFYPYNPAINGFWKKGNDGNWSDVSTSISHVGTTKTKITISLVEGGNFDTDGAGNGTLTDPGGAGIGGANAIPTLSEWMLILLAMMLGFFAALKMKGHRDM